MINEQSGEKRARAHAREREWNEAIKTPIIGIHQMLPARHVWQPYPKAPIALRAALYMLASEYASIAELDHLIAVKFASR